MPNQVIESRFSNHAPSPHLLHRLPSSRRTAECSEGTDGTQRHIGNGKNLHAYGG